MPRLDHPEGCGCAVCLNWQEQLENDRSAREVDASMDEVDRYQPDVDEYHDPDPQPAPQEPVVVEHHHYYADPDAPADGGTTVVRERVVERRNDDGSRSESRRTRRRLKRLERRSRRRRGFLRSMVILLVSLFVLQSFYPELDVPLVPGVSCTDPSSTTVATATGTQPVLWNPFDLGDQLGDLAEEAIGTVVKKAAVYTVGAALNVVGDTFRAMASHPPTTDGIRQGLENDVELLGKVVGFVWSAVGGEPPDSLVDLTVPEASNVYSCAPCPTDGSGGGSVPVGASGARVAAQVATQVGFAGESAVMAVAVAGAESGWKSVRSPVNDNGTYDHGYWQINSIHADLLARYDWRDPLDNARMAWEISDHGTDWSPWTTYDNGDYQQHLDAARAALGGTTVAAMVGAGLVNGPGPDGVQPKVEQAAQFVRDTWGFEGTIHGWRLDYDSEHYKGLAMDVMVGDDKTTGDAIAQYFVDNAAKWGVNNVIWQQRITNAGRGWRWPGDLMEDRGGVTDNHYDHPHIDFHPGPLVEGAPPAPTDAQPAGATPAAEVCTVPVTAGDPGDGWRVATFNILGAGHTDNVPGRGGNTNPCCPGWQQRWPAQQQLLETKGVSVVGFQEVHREQLGAVRRMAGWDYVGEFDAVTAWREGVWALEDRQYIWVPSLGNTRPMPLVRLRHVETGTLVWFLNVHNSIRDYQEREAMRRELAVVRTLPGPVVWMGDFNNPRTPSELARAGFRTSTPFGIDYIAGRGVSVVNGQRDDVTKRQRISDHVIVTSDLTVERTS